jgi:hypothetical protein
MISLFKNPSPAAIAAGLTIAILLIAEVALRQLGIFGLPTDYVGKGAKTLPYVQIVPQTDDKLWSRSAKFNNTNGFRGPSDFIPDTKKILFLGDSVAYGSHLELDVNGFVSMTGLTEKDLDAQPIDRESLTGSPVPRIFPEVTNNLLSTSNAHSYVSLAMGGYNIRQIQDSWHYLGKPLSPETIIYTYCYNDLYPATTKDGVVYKDLDHLEKRDLLPRQLRAKSYLAAFINDAISYIFPLSAQEKSIVGHQRLFAAWKEEMRAMRDSLTTNQALAVVVTARRKTDNCQASPVDNLQVIDFLEKEGIAVFDAGFLAKDPANYLDCDHLSIKGHEALGKELANFIDNQVYDH